MIAAARGTHLLLCYCLQLFSVDGNARVSRDPKLAVLDGEDGDHALFALRVEREASKEVGREALHALLVAAAHVLRYAHDRIYAL